MFLPVPIPIGSREIVVARGTFWYFVSCPRCQQPYAYQVELEASGECLDLLFLDGDGAWKQARRQAEENLLLKGQTSVVPVPCPSCGAYPEAMAKRLQDDSFINRGQIVGGTIVAISLLPVLLGFVHLWPATAVAALVGLTLLARGYSLAFRYDPNAGDPEARKAMARSCCVWGDALKELLQTARDEGPSQAPADTEGPPSSPAGQAEPYEPADP